MTRRAPEAALQRAVTEYLTLALGPGCFFTAIPLGGGGRVRGAILKATGTKQGTPDLLLVNMGQAIFIELKSQRGRVSAEQHACHEAIRAACGIVLVCRSIADVESGLLRYGVPLRARAA